jgi:dihydrofolate reductase
MRDLILKMSISLDGFVGGPNGEADWVFRTNDEKAADWTVSLISNASLHIMGSRTYHDMAAWWPYSDEVYAPPMNDIPKGVFTRKGAASLSQPAATQAVKDAEAALEKAGGKKKAPDPKVLKGWADPYVASGPMAEEVKKLKSAAGKAIIAHGGAGFARSLIATGLVDEYALLVHPIVLGRGLPIFSDLSAPKQLKLIRSIAFPAGAVGHVYRPA